MAFRGYGVLFFFFVFGKGVETCVYILKGSRFFGGGDNGGLGYFSEVYRFVNVKLFTRKGDVKLN